MNVILLMHDLTRFLTISLSGELSTLLLRNRGVSDVGFSIFADTDADFAF